MISRGWGLTNWQAGALIRPEPPRDCTESAPHHPCDIDRGCELRVGEREPTGCETAGMEIARSTSGPVDLQFIVVGQPVEGDPTGVL